MCVGSMNSGPGTTVPAQGSQAGMGRGWQFLGAFLQKQSGNPGPLEALKAQFRNNHAGMTAQQVVQQRRGTIPLGGPVPGVPGPSPSRYGGR